MAEIISFQAAKKKQAKQKSQGRTMCREGHHKWQINQDKQFDSQSGKLVTIFQCQRCGKKQTKLL